MSSTVTIGKFFVLSVWLVYSVDLYGLHFSIGIISVIVSQVFLVNLAEIYRADSTRDVKGYAPQ